MEYVFVLFFLSVHHLLICQCILPLSEKARVNVFPLNFTFSIEAKLLFIDNVL